MNRTPLRIGLAVLIAVGVLGGVALVSADDGNADADAIQWMHDRVGDHVHGDHHDGDHDHGEHHDGDHAHSDYHDGDHTHDDHHGGNHQPGDHYGGAGAC